MRTRLAFLASFEKEEKSEGNDKSELHSRAWLKVFFACFLFQKKVGQADKSARGMPWHQEPMKVVTSCDKLRGGANSC